MKSAHLLSLASVLAMSCHHQEPFPNVVIIYADDIGYGDLGSYGAVAVNTPHSDRLADEGIRFTRAYSAAATCTPSRYSLLTGEYAFRRSDTGVARGDAPMVIKKEQFNVARMMQDAGYNTAIIGKWHLGLGEGGFNHQDWNGSITPGPRELGFHYSYFMAATGDRTPCVFIENDRVVNLDPADPLEVSYDAPFTGEPLGRTHPELLKMHPSHGHDMAIVNGISRIGYMRGGNAARWIDENIADSITLKAVQFIENNHPRKTGKPFFLYFGAHDIHVPRVPHPRFAGTTDMGPRGDCIVEFDWSVGEILATLDRLNLSRNTLVILSSDNGPVVDDGYHDEAVERLGNHLPAGNLRGGKYSAFEAGTRVPFIVRWPDKIKPSQSDALVSQVDFIAVMAELIQREIPEGVAFDAQPELATWMGKNPVGRDYVVIQSTGTLALIKDQWKYIKPSEARRYNPQVDIELGNDTLPQFYFLASDAGETINRAFSDSVKRVAFEEQLNKIIQRN